MKSSKYILITLSLFWYILGFSQNSKVIDSLVQKSHQLKRNELVDTYNQLAWEFRKKDDSIAIHYATLGQKLSDSLRYQKGLATSHIRIGTIFLNKNQFIKAEKHLQQALKIEEGENNLSGVGRAKTQLGKLYKKNGDYDKAIKFYKESLAIKMSLKDKKNIALLYNNIARTYEAKNNLDIALGYYHKSIDIKKELKDHRGLISSYKNLGGFYNKLKRYNSAIIELNKAKKFVIQLQDSIQLASVLVNIGSSYLGLNKVDEALSYYTQSLAILKKSKTEDKTLILNNIANIYKKKSDTLKSIEFYQKSIQEGIQNNQQEKLIFPYYNLGNLYLHSGKFKEALDLYHKADTLSYKFNNENFRAKTYMSIAETYEKLKNYKKASEYNEISAVLQQQLERKRIKEDEQIKMLEYEKNKSHILKVEKDREKAQNDRKTTILYSLITGCILLSILFFTFFRNLRLKQQAIIAAQNEKIKQKEIEELLKKQELKSIHAMIDGQEKERKRIAQDLHDRLGSMLSVVKMHYKSVEENLDRIKEESKEQYQKANQLLDDACHAVREISHNMVSGVLTKFGLVPALNELVENIQEANQIDIEFIDHGFDDRIDNSIEINLYRIIQELISNILKHANATEISVQLLKNKEGIHITVIDDGVGFDAEKRVYDAGMGLKGIHSRVLNLDGDIDIDSGKGNGTTITITIPIPDQNNEL